MQILYEELDEIHKKPIVLAKWGCQTTMYGPYWQPRHLFEDKPEMAIMRQVRDLCRTFWNQHPDRNLWSIVDLVGNEYRAAVARDRYRFSK